MFLSMKLSTFAFLALLVYSEARFVPEGRYQFGDSYIDDVKLSYENGTYQCDLITCPLGVYGCKIQRKNDPQNPLQLITNNTCYLKNNDIVRSAFDTLAIPANKTVNIDINSFVGAITFYSIGYEMYAQPGKTKQTVKGIIAADDWPEVQQITRNVIETTESYHNATYTS